MNIKHEGCGEHKSNHTFKRQFFFSFSLRGMKAEGTVYLWVSKADQLEVQVIT